MPLAKGKFPDTEVAPGRWISVAGRNVGEVCEIWLNGRLAARVNDPRSNDRELARDSITVQALATPDRPSRLEIDYVAVWELKPTSVPNEPLADKPPPKNLFPGELIAYETFDDPKTCPFPTIQTAAKNARCENGAYVEDLLKAKEDEVQGHQFGGPVRDLAVAARFRTMNGLGGISFRHRLSATSRSYLLFQVHPDGSWFVHRINWNHVNNEWKLGEQTLLAQDRTANPEMAEGKWIAFRLKSIGPTAEIWAGPKMYVKLHERDGKEDLLPLDPSAGVQIGMTVSADGPARFEYDYAAVWKLTDPAITWTGDKPPPRDLFPGSLLAHETFDKQKDAKPIPKGMAGTYIGVEHGAKVLAMLQLPQNVSSGITLGEPARDLAIVARTRRTNARLSIVFSSQVKENRLSTWEFGTAGNLATWFVRRFDSEKVGDDWSIKKIDDLAVSTEADPELAMDKWSTVTIRAQGSSIEVWVNGQRIARVKDEKRGVDGFVPFEQAMSIGGMKTADADARIEIDYAAVWKLTEAGITPTSQNGLSRQGCLRGHVRWPRVEQTHCREQRPNERPV